MNLIPVYGTRNLTSYIITLKWVLLKKVISKMLDLITIRLLMDWQVHQFVQSSKVKTEVQVSNPHELYLYVSIWIFY